MFGKGLNQEKAVHKGVVSHTNINPCQPVLFDLGQNILLSLALYLICQYLAPSIQQQKKIRSQKYGLMGIRLSDWVENIVGKEHISCS